MKLIQRADLLKQVMTGLRRSRCVSLLGPRQCGKTTLARQIFEHRRGEYFDLEDPAAQARLQNPMMALEGLKGLVIIDEIQLKPDLYPILRVLLDRDPLPARFLLLGSASPDLVRGVSESLAGRVEFISMAGFHLDEIGFNNMEKLWIRGGFPPSFLAKKDADSLAWRDNFILTFLERDLRRLGFNMAPQSLRRFWTMVAHYHGQTWNGSEIASSLQVAHTTTRRYLDLLTGAFLVRQLPPWFENIKKRQKKSPKVYIRDSGLLHSLLGIDDRVKLESNPKLGASWEGFALEQVLRFFRERDAYYWGPHGGAELDLFVHQGKQRIGFEFKYTEAPSTTRSMHTAVENLNLDHLYIIHPGKESFPIQKKITALILKDLADKLK
ncbi:MAG: ATP-binding protein [Planctomycetota bacterium]|jgi:predicted AAA+ superfamily ATPase